MTISSDSRKRQEEELIGKLTKLLGDEMLIDLMFRESAFPDVMKTTWYSLYNREVLERSAERGTDGFYLTPGGWVMGLELTGKMSEPEFLSPLGEVCATVKKYVKDRDEDGLVHCSEIAKDANVPLGWLANVISSLIEEKFAQHGPHWAEGMYVEIPLDVGIKF